MPSTKDRRTGSSEYRKPPVAHQFKKGTSGNPKGRPRKKAVPGFGALGGGIADRFGAMALDEATRPITVREGDKVSEIPAMQALIRTMFRAAAEGDTRAGRQLLEVIARAESGRTGFALEILQHAIQYKETYGPIFEQREREGGDPLDIFPHPDDLIIDQTTGEVTIDGPMSKEQAGARKAVREQAIESMRRYFEVEAALAKDPTNRALKREFKELKKYHDIFEQDSERMHRHEALRLSRLALETKPQEPDTEISDEPSTAVPGSKQDE
jgi:Family of unknown function (DUF5681)